MIDTVVSSFFIGATGSFAHCCAMFTPFVLYISSKYTGETAPGYALLIPHVKYNLGRITTYTLMGFMAGLLKSLTVFKNINHAGHFVEIVAGLVLIMYASKNFINFPKVASFGKGRFTGLLDRLIRAKGAYPVGVILGFLPCGLVLGALINTLTAGSVFISAVSMAVFGLGTSLSLLITALLGGVIQKYIKIARYLFAFTIFGFGIMWLYRGVTAVI
jgi:sulfite exporter TauE/SafE